MLGHQPRCIVVVCVLCHLTYLLCPVKKLPRNTPTSQQAGLRGRELHVRDTEVHKQVREEVEDCRGRGWMVGVEDCRGRGWKVVERIMSTFKIDG